MKIFLGELLFLINKYHELKPWGRQHYVLSGMARIFVHPINFWTQGSYGASVHMHNLIDFVETIRQEAGEGAKCDCCIMEALPTSEIIKTWKRSKYVFCANGIYYCDKNSGTTTQLKIAAEKIKELLSKFGVGKDLKELSDEQLYEITSLSAHMHLGPELSDKQKNVLVEILITEAFDRSDNYDDLTDLIFHCVARKINFNVPVDFLPAHPAHPYMDPTSLGQDQRVLAIQEVLRSRIDIDSEHKGEDDEALEKTFARQALVLPWFIYNQAKASEAGMTFKPTIATLTQLEAEMRQAFFKEAKLDRLTLKLEEELAQNIAGAKDRMFTETLKKGIEDFSKFKKQLLADSLQGGKRKLEILGSIGASKAAIQNVIQFALQNGINIFWQELLAFAKQCGCELPLVFAIIDAAQGVNPQNAIAQVLKESLQQEKKLAIAQAYGLVTSGSQKVLSHAAKEQIIVFAKGNNFSDSIRMGMLFQFFNYCPVQNSLAISQNICEYLPAAQQDGSVQGMTTKSITSSKGTSSSSSSSSMFSSQPLPSTQGNGKIPEQTSKKTIAPVTTVPTQSPVAARSEHALQKLQKQQKQQIAAPVVPSVIQGVQGVMARIQSKLDKVPFPLAPPTGQQPQRQSVATTTSLPSKAPALFSQGQQKQQDKTKVHRPPFPKRQLPPLPAPSGSSLPTSSAVVSKS
jgi:hypothetical protein